MNRKKFFIGVAVVLILSIVGVSIYNTLNSTKETISTGINGPKNGLSVKVDKINVEDIVNSIKAEGQIEMKDKSVVYSPSTAKVDVVNFVVGDKVKKGDVLLSYKENSMEDLVDELTLARLDLKAAHIGLDTITIPASDDIMLQLEAQLRSKNDTVELAKKSVEQIDLKISTTNEQLVVAQNNLNDGSFLFSNDIITKKELESLENNVVSIENSIKSLELERENAVEAIDSARLSLIDTESQIEIEKNRNSSKSVLNQVETQKIAIEKLNLRIKSLEKQIEEFKVDVLAENDGIILIRNVDIGTTAQKGSTLFTIGSTDNNNLIVKVNVLEVDSGELLVGQEAIIEGEALGDRKVKGFISKIYPTVEDMIIGNSSKRVVVVEIDVVDEDLTIRAGSTVKATITTSIDKAKTMAPLMSLNTDDNGKDYVYVVKDDYSVEKRIIELGTYTGSYVAVNNVLEGDIVVIDPPSILKDGDFIKYTNLENEENEE